MELKRQQELLRQEEEEKRRQEAERERQRREMELKRQQELLRQEAERERQRREMELKKQQELLRKEEEEKRRQEAERERLLREAEQFFYALSTDRSPTFKLGALLSVALNKYSFWKVFEDRNDSDESTRTILFRLGIFVPYTERIREQERQLANMIKTWVDARFEIDKVQIQDCGRNSHIRLVSTFVNEDEVVENCEHFDGILNILPPMYVDLLSYAQCPIDNAPQITINFDEMQNIDSEECDACLQNSCKALFDKYASLVIDNRHEIQAMGLMLEQLSLRKVGVQLMKKLIWLCPDYEVFGNKLIEFCLKLLNELFLKIADFSETFSSQWPGKEFDENGNAHVEGYFSNNEALPMNWLEFGQISTLKHAAINVFSNLNGAIDIESFIQSLINEADPDIQGMCSMLYNDGQYRRCLEYALTWFDNETLSDHIFYLPVGFARNAVSIMIESGQKHFDLALEEQIRVITKTRSNEIGDETTKNDSDQIFDEIKNFDNYNFVDENTTITMYNNNMINKKRSTNSENGMSPSGRPQKRKKKESFFDQDLKTSKNFTANLKALADGGTLDMFIGDSSLSKILGCIDK